MISPPFNWETQRIISYKNRNFSFIELSLFTLQYLVTCDVGAYILRHVQEINPSSLTPSKNFLRVYTKKELRYNYAEEHEVFSKANVSLENISNRGSIHCGAWTRRNVKLRKPTDGANEKNRTSRTPVGHARVFACPEQITTIFLCIYICLSWRFVSAIITQIIQIIAIPSANLFYAT